MVEMADVAGAEFAFARHEHTELRAGLDQMHAAARTLTGLPVADAAGRLRPVCQWLSEELLPHVAWEGAVIFPEIDEISASTWPTRLMRFDHIQIHRTALLVERDIERICIGETTGEDRRDAYDHLIALEALIRAHLEREETFLIPVLDGRLA
jgi:iron-sulfur cluster repair protein YtfE (RIC family)